MNDKMLSNDLMLLAKAIDAAKSSLIITDQRLPDHPIIFCNPAFEQLTGYHHTEIIGRNCRFLQRDDRGQPGLTEIREAISSGKPCTVFLRNYCKDGTAFWNELMLSPVQDEQGRVTHFIGIQNDITTRMAGKSFGDLKNLASHELNTPLTTIKGTLQLLQQRGLDVDTGFLQKSLDAALRAVHRLEQFGREIFE